MIHIEVEVKNIALAVAYVKVLAKLTRVLIYLFPAHTIVDFVGWSVSKILRVKVK